MTGRAKSGQGRNTLQALAIDAASDLGHDLGRFYAAEGKSKRRASVLYRGRLIETAAPAVFRAQCKRCSAPAIIDQHEWERDGRGYGGLATRERCAKEGEPCATPA